MDKDRSHTERNGKSLVKKNPVPPPGISMFVCCTFMTVYPAGLFDGDIVQTASAWLTYTYNTHTKDLYIPHNHSLKIPPNYYSRPTSTLGAFSHHILLQF